jgi:hypothetical protein
MHTPYLRNDHLANIVLYWITVSLYPLLAATTLSLSPLLFHSISLLFLSRGSLLCKHHLAHARYHRTSTVASEPSCPYGEVG